MTTTGARQEFGWSRAEISGAVSMASVSMTCDAFKSYDPVFDEPVPEAKET